MQKLFITDLDHTFLHSNQSVTPFSKAIWNTKADHAMLSIATARSFAKTNAFLSELKLNFPLITLDGAMVADRQKRIIDLNVLNKEIGDAIIEEGQKKGVVQIGSTVTLQREGEKDKHEYTIVGSTEADPIMRKISNESPVGEAIIGKKLKDKVKVVAPGGVYEYTIIKVS